MHVDVYHSEMARRRGARSGYVRKGRNAVMQEPTTIPAATVRHFRSSKPFQ